LGWDRFETWGARDGRAERYLDVFVRSPLPQAVTDLDLRLLAVNSAYSGLVGYSEEELLGRAVDDVTHPEDSRVSEAMLARLLRGEQDHATVEKRLVRRDGVARSARLHVVLLRDPDGEPDVLHGTLEDLTEQRAVEAALRESEQRLRVLTEHSEDAVLIVGANGDIEYTSANVSEELRARGGTNIFDHVAPAHAPALRQMLAKVTLERSPGRTLRLRSRWSPERVWDVRFEPVEGSAGRVVLATREITGELRTQRLAEDEASVLRMLLRDAPRDEVLAAIARLFEAHVPEVRCTVFVREGDLLRCVAAPSLPPDFTASVRHIRIAEGEGTCGTAAHRGEPVITEDVLEDASWARYRGAARAAGVRACWSLPVLDGRGELLGTLCFYRAEPGRPDEREWALAQRLAKLTALALRQVRPPTAPPPAPAALQRLSEREREVLRLVALGHTNPEVAELLAVSVRTVETHRANVARKLGATSRAELVRLALRGGLLTDHA
jgi:PAS domain S-box-containing protein